MKINLSELEKTIVHILETIKKQNGELITIEKDYYWNIPTVEKYNTYARPQKIDMGQVSFDIEDLNKIQKNADEIIPNFHLKKISAILEAISIQI
jgi:hypothetical protein